MKKTILIIDDDDRLLLATSVLLEQSGYEVLTHRGAFGATHVISTRRPDLVLLDVHMPGLSGEGLIQALRKRHELDDVRIVLYSSSDEDDLRELTRTLGLAGYVCKGDLVALRERLPQFLAA